MPLVSLAAPVALDVVTGAALALAGAAMARLAWLRLHGAELHGFARRPAGDHATRRVSQVDVGISRAAAADRLSTHRHRRAVTGSRWALDRAGGGDAERCAAFLDRLDSMPMAEWLDVARRARSSRASSSTQRAAATACLESIIVARRVAVTAWLVRDAVGTAAGNAASHACPSPSGRRNAGPPCTLRERSLLLAAREVAEQTALAHLARPWLPRSEYLTLISPFVSLRADDGEAVGSAAGA